MSEPIPVANRHSRARTLEDIGSLHVDQQCPVCGPGRYVTTVQRNESYIICMTERGIELEFGSAKPRRPPG